MEFLTNGICTVPSVPRFRLILVSDSHNIIKQNFTTIGTVQIPLVKHSMIEDTKEKERIMKEIGEE